jgi:hypothetical protein
VAVAGHVVVSGVSETPGGVAHDNAMLCNQLLPPKIETATFPAEQYDHLDASPPNHCRVEVEKESTVPSELIFVHRALTLALPAPVAIPVIA